jgi:hypothetical protein
MVAPLSGAGSAARAALDKAIRVVAVVRKRMRFLRKGAGRFRANVMPSRTAAGRYPKSRIRRELLNYTRQESNLQPMAP